MSSLSSSPAAPAPAAANHYNLNHSQNLLNEIKRFFKHANQLNILLRETNNAHKDLKIFQQSTHLSENIENLQLNENDDLFIKSLQKKKISFIILGQNVLAKSLIVNELLSRYILPFHITSHLNDENWKFIRIKHGKIPGFSYQLVDSEFEVMTSDILNKKQTISESSPKISNEKTSPTNRSNALSSPSSSSFTMSLEEVRQDDSLTKAREFYKKAQNEQEKIDALDQVKKAESMAENQAILEISLDHKLLEQNLEILVPNNLIQKSMYEKLTQNTIPIYIYGIIGSDLSEKELEELNESADLIKNDPIFFVKIPEIEKYLKHHGNSKNNFLSSQSLSPSSSSSTSSLSSSGSSPVDQYQQKLKRANNLLKYLHNSSQNQSHNSLAIFGQLYNLKFLNIIPSGSSNSTDYDYLELNFFQAYTPTSSQAFSQMSFQFESEFCEKWHLFLTNFVNFVKRYLKTFSVRGTTILYKFHEHCLKQFINFAFEIARDMMITPRKIEYAREKEQILFESLNSLASIKQEELKILINNALEANRESILQASKNFEFNDVELVNFESSETHTETSNLMTVKYARDYKKCTSQIQELVINKLNNAISQKLTESVEILKENYIGTLKRCLITLEELNLNTSKDSIDPNSASVSEALQQILNSAYQVDVNLSGSSSILKIFLQRMKELIRNMPWSASPKLDEEWKMSIASNMLENLCESKLAKILCNQMKDKLKSSHSQFTASLKMLETKHTGRLEKNEEYQNLIRKILAPKFAKLCLESKSLKDYVLYGFPILGKEIGRGQYGVVYSCQKWGKYEHLAVKSVVPPDEKHWNDLALEFHYTKQIADHDKIVKLLGSVIDYNYGNGNSPAVLLIMEAMKRDLYQGLKAGLDWKTRLKISLDVVEGIRYLHGLGLVHRDIKLKNVLLDTDNRAKITDLGFCKPEAMMSGSIVGTPVHMCPEMFDTKYDNTVDIYAFGILFWYICAGSVSLPKNFEQCSTKDDLWSSVKRGVRPERLSIFDEDCWTLMEICWQHDPKSRPHIGVVADHLNKINKKYDTC